MGRAPFPLQGAFPGPAGPCPGGCPCPLLVVLVVYVHALPLALGCILLLNGWEPLSVGERALLAEVVITTYVRETYKETRTDANTYTAQVLVINVLKGQATLDTVPAHGTEPGVYNVSNFGDKVMCYADVDQGESYILFLTTFGGRLSAKYDDIFGAVAEYTVDAEEDILRALGWRSWSAWGACSHTCGNHGVQTRTRECSRMPMEECEGLRTQKRSCNTFSCAGAHDLLYLVDIGRFPGVNRSSDRPSAYSINESATILLPTSQVYSEFFPQDFSILVSAKPEYNNEGFIFTISDPVGFVKLGLQVGTNPIFEYADQGNLPGRSSPRFAVDLSDGNWHQFAYSVRGQTVTLIMDCIFEMTKPLGRSMMPFISVSSIMAIGRTYVRNRRYPQFVGDIEQLVLVDDPDAAYQQCNRKPGPTTPALLTTSTELVTAITMTTTPAMTTASEIPTTTRQKPVVVWSEWTGCSATCGQGLQMRTAFCSDNTVNLDKCGGSQLNRIQTKPCALKRCPGQCRRPCKHGGVCLRRGRCACRSGYYGKFCQHVSCYPGCLYGGRCVQPNVCRCPRGYTGLQCQYAVCEPPCLNGGHCVRPDVCSCTFGFSPPDCGPICRVPCYNGGTCIGFDRCKCISGYDGNQCQTAVCEQGCENGGWCVAPNICACPSGYTGPTCTPVSDGCSSMCRNGGTCIGPDLCQCPQGYSGKHCQFSACYPRCENGGVCVGPDICRCQEGYHGFRCENRDSSLQTSRRCHYHAVERPSHRAHRKMEICI